MLFPDESQVKILVNQPKYGDKKLNILLLAETKEAQFFVFSFSGNSIAARECSSWSITKKQLLFLFRVFCV